ncbi:hypothetical protein XELAEV_18000018mg, partial [Xenopus laevis]
CQGDDVTLNMISHLPIRLDSDKVSLMKCFRHDIITLAPGKELVVERNAGISSLQGLLVSAIHFKDNNKEVFTLLGTPLLLYLLVSFSLKRSVE